MNVRGLLSTPAAPADKEKLIQHSVPSENQGIDVQDEDGNTALISASQHHHTQFLGKLEKVKALIEAKANINIQNALKDTALIVATWSSYDKIVKTLIESKADPTIQGRFGRTALHWAVDVNEEEIVSELIKARADLETRDDEGKTALDEAITHRENIFKIQNLSIVNNLLNAGARIEKPKRLLALLKECDQRDPAVSYAMEKIIKDKGDALLLMDEHEYLELDNYLNKLRGLEKMTTRNDRQREIVFNNIDEGTGSQIKIPIPLIDIITSYYYPPLTKLSFFKSAQIDNMLMSAQKNFSNNKKSTNKF